MDVWRTFSRTKRKFAVATRHLLHTDTFLSAVIQLQFLFWKSGNLHGRLKDFQVYQTEICSRNKAFTAHKDVSFCGNTIALSFWKSGNLHWRLKSYCRTKREFAVATRHLLHTDTFRFAVPRVNLLVWNVTGNCFHHGKYSLIICYVLTLSFNLNFAVRSFAVCAKRFIAVWTEIFLDVCKKTCKRNFQKRKIWKSKTK